MASLIWRYILNILISIDQLANSILFGNPDETISSRVGKRRNDSIWWRFLNDTINFIFFWEPHHTCKSIEEDEK